MKPPKSKKLTKRQLDALKKKRSRAMMASELEFYLFDTTYSAAFDADYRHLRPSSDYRIDYHLLQPGRDENILGSIRRECSASGIPGSCIFSGLGVFHRTTPTQISAILYFWSLNS